jgi:hypothetical protein
MDEILADPGRRRFMTGVLGLSAALALPARPSLAYSLPVPDRHIARRFNVFWGKDLIGTHEIEVLPARTAGDWDVAVEIDFLIDLGLFGEITYRHRSRESWRDGRIVELTSHTDDDGDVVMVVGRAAGAAFRITGPDGTADAPGSLVTSNSAWSEAICRQRRIIDATTGAVVDFRAKPEGARLTTTAAGQEVARSYQVTCPLIAGSFWYDAAGLWMRGRLDRKGEKIDYFLDM